MELIDKNLLIIELSKYGVEAVMLDDTKALKVINKCIRTIEEARVYDLSIKG